MLYSFRTFVFTQIKSFLLFLPGFRIACRRATKNHVRVFMYHRFSTVEVAEPLFVSTDVLAVQLVYTKKHHVIISCDQHVLAVDNLESLGDCPVVFTVDDGYADAVELAVPVFERLQAPVTIFLATGFTEGKYWFWWDRLRYILDSVSSIPDQIHLSTSVHVSSRYVETNASLAITRDRISEVLVQLHPSDIEKVLVELAETLNVTVPIKSPQCYKASDWEKVELSESKYIRFAAHTVNHPSLTRLDIDEATDELRDSLDHCRGHLRNPSFVICYPFGTQSDYSDKIRSLLPEIGVSGAYTSHEQADHLDSYALPRYFASNDYVQFHWNLCGAAHIVKRLRCRLSQANIAPVKSALRRQ